MKDQSDEASVRSEASREEGGSQITPGLVIHTEFK